MFCFVVKCAERFFRVEPARHMSKAQFVVAMNRCFGEGYLKPEALGKLFDTFDVSILDQMDWRAFLYLLTICTMPDKPCIVHLR